jgi:hypothetical protein
MGASRCLLGLIALFVSSANAHAVDCLVSAAPARQADAKAWLTLRAPGGESSTCWYAATRTTGHDYQQRITAIAELIAVPPNAVSSPETYGFNGGLLFDTDKGNAARYAYFIDMAGSAWHEYQRWHAHPQWNDKRLREPQRQAVRDDDGFIKEISDGIVFPILSALSRFVKRKNGHWKIVYPKSFRTTTC